MAFLLFANPIFAGFALVEQNLQGLISHPNKKA
jgi:hypothetical protein